MPLKAAVKAVKSVLPGPPALVCSTGQKHPVAYLQLECSTAWSFTALVLKVFFISFYVYLISPGSLTGTAALWACTAPLRELLVDIIFTSLRSQAHPIALLSEVFLSCCPICLCRYLWLYCCVEHKATGLSYQKSSAACLASFPEAHNWVVARWRRQNTHRNKRT